MENLAFSICIRDRKAVHPILVCRIVLYIVSLFSVIIPFSPLPAVCLSPLYTIILQAVCLPADIRTISVKCLLAKPHLDPAGFSKIRRCSLYCLRFSLKYHRQPFCPVIGLSREKQQKARAKSRGRPKQPFSSPHAAPMRISFFFHADAPFPIFFYFFGISRWISARTGWLRAADKEDPSLGNP